MLGDVSKANIGKFDAPLPSDYSLTYTMTFYDNDTDGIIELSAKSTDRISVKTSRSGNVQGTVQDTNKAISELWAGDGVLIKDDASVRFKITNAPPFAQGINSITFSASTGKVSAEAGQEMWKVKYGIYYVAEDAEDCSGIMEDSPVTSDQGVLEFTKTFYVKEEGAAGTGGTTASGVPICSLDRASLNLPCDCNGNGNNQEGFPKDCTGQDGKFTDTGNTQHESKWSYCYNSSGTNVKECHLFAKCSQGFNQATALPCDCNFDGKMNFETRDEAGVIKGDDCWGTLMNCNLGTGCSNAPVSGTGTASTATSPSPYPGVQCKLQYGYKEPDPCDCDLDGMINPDPNSADCDGRTKVYCMERVCVAE
jgi:hypothetical protein